MKSLQGPWTIFVSHHGFHHFLSMSLLLSYTMILMLVMKELKIWDGSIYVAELHHIILLKWWVVFGSPNFEFTSKHWNCRIWRLYSWIYCWAHEHNLSTKWCYAINMLYIQHNFQMNYGKKIYIFFRLLATLFYLFASRIKSIIYWLEDIMMVVCLRVSYECIIWCTL